MGNIALKVENISKQYHIEALRHRYNSLADLLAHKAKSLLRGNGQTDPEATTIWALNDVSLEVQKGEVVAIIGRNGSGKSTLLKILSRITEPTSGRAQIYGRVGSLLEVGTGFHQDLTGRENIYLNGSILGMKKAEIDRRFDEIVSFSGVERFIDTPVKRYSSGMSLRLGFSVAAHLEYEILIVDEVLAVGDAAFQQKCLGKMHDTAQGGRTVLFVSHNMATITQLCGRAFWLEQGRLRFTGSVFDAVASYLSSASVNPSTWTAPSNQTSEAEFAVKAARILSKDNQPTAVVAFDKQCKVEIAWELIRPQTDLSIICRLADSTGNIIWTSWDTDNTNWKRGYVRKPGCYVSICTVPARLLKPASYHLSIGACSRDHKFALHERVLAFEVSEVGYHLNPGRTGVIVPVLEWEVRQVDGSV